MLAADSEQVLAEFLPEDLNDKDGRHEFAGIQVGLYQLRRWGLRGFLSEIAEVVAYGEVDVFLGVG